MTEIAEEVRAMLLRVWVAAPEITVLETFTGTCLSPLVPNNLPAIKLRLVIVAESIIPKLPLFRVRVVKVMLSNRTLPEFNVKLLAVTLVTLKRLGLPVKEPVPVTAATVKEPTERETAPEEERDEASNLTLLRFHDPALVMKKDPLPEIAMVETAKAAPEVNLPSITTEGLLGVGAPSTMVKAAFCIT